MNRTFDIKVVGYEAIAAESEQDALDKFDRLLDKGYTVSDLRWKSVCAFDVEAGGESSEMEMERLLKEARENQK